MMNSEATSTDGSPAPHEAGTRRLAIRKEVLGAAHVERSLAKASEFSRPVQEFVTEYCWGDDLDPARARPATRSLLNLVMLTALGRIHELGGPRARRDHQRVHRRRDPGGAAADGGLLRRAGGSGVLPGRRARARGARGGQRRSRTAELPGRQSASSASGTWARRWPPARRGGLDVRAFDVAPGPRAAFADFGRTSTSRPRRPAARKGRRSVLMLPPRTSSRRCSPGAARGAGAGRIARRHGLVGAAATRRSPTGAAPGRGLSTRRSPAASRRPSGHAHDHGRRTAPRSPDSRRCSPPSAPSATSGRSGPGTR